MPITILLAASALAVPPPGTGSWRVSENGPAACSLSRIYPGYERVELLLDADREVEIRIHSTAPQTEGESLEVNGKLYPGGAEGWDLGEGDAFLAALEAAPAIELRGPGGAVDSFPLDGFQEAAARLRQCVEPLRVQVEAERQEALAAEAVPLPAVKARARARGNVAGLLSDDDYPAFALRDEIEGTTGFRLRIGADGRVKGCTVTSSSGSLGLDVVTCRLMRSRATFAPARDRRGRAIEDHVSSRITWRIAED